MTQLWFSVRSLRRTRSKIIIKVTSNNQRLGQPLEVRKGHLTDGQNSIHSSGDVTRDESQRRFLAQHNAAMLEQCCNHSKQCRNNVARLCCPKNVKNRRCESSRVTSSLVEV